MESNGKHKETSMVLDLSEFVTEVDRFSRLIEPFAMVFYLIDDIRRWVFIVMVPCQRYYSFILNTIMGLYKR